MSTDRRHRPDRRRRVPPLGGFNLTVLRIELRRMLRNRRTHHLHAGLPGRPVLRDRVGQPAGTSRPATATWRPTSWSRWRCTARR